jgi:ABC-2 type transport system ATP-binding protein
MMSLFDLADVTHRYGKVCALRDVSFAAQPGAIGLVGQNGAGKSTLLQILLGLIHPTKGSARVLGLDVAVAGLQLRGAIGYMPERDAFIPGLRGIEYVALAGRLCGMSRRQAHRRAHEVLSYLRLEEARYRPLQQYSVGMKQRLKLAATLVHDPDVLLLDEPTAGLDPEGRLAMLQVLHTLASRPNRSLVLSSHLLGDVERVCHSVIILSSGRVIRAGRIDQLRQARRGSYRIQWQGDATAMLDGLHRRGVRIDVAEHRDSARILLPPGVATSDVFAEAALQNVILTGLEPAEEDFEMVYRRLVGGADGGS